MATPGRAKAAVENITPIHILLLVGGLIGGFLALMELLEYARKIVK